MYKYQGCLHLSLLLHYWGSRNQPLNTTIVSSRKRSITSKIKELKTKSIDSKYKTWVINRVHLVIALPSQQTNRRVRKQHPHGRQIRTKIKNLCRRVFHQPQRMCVKKIISKNKINSSKSCKLLKLRKKILNNKYIFKYLTVQLCFFFFFNTMPLEFNFSTCHMG